MVTQSQTIGRDTSWLVREAQAGDKDAVDELVTTHLSLIYNIIGRALDGHPDVDDLVQNTMLQAIRGLGSLREPDRFRAWLVTIAYRQSSCICAPAAHPAGVGRPSRSRSPTRAATSPSAPPPS